MVLSRRDLDRIAEDIYLDRRIRSSTYCSNCAYNLRTLPYAYHCPECGQAYNARPHNMKGIFFPLVHYPPFGLMGACLFFALVAFVILLGVSNSYSVERLVIGLVFVAMFVIYAMRAVGKYRRYAHERMIARQIMEDDAD